jgi:dihydroorotase-like cyclic amidohydrolase
VPARGVDTVVRGGRVVTASEGLETGIAIQGGTLVALGDPRLLPPAEREIDAAGKGS